MHCAGFPHPAAFLLGMPKFHCVLEESDGVSNLPCQHCRNEGRISQADDIAHDGRTGVLNFRCNGVQVKKHRQAPRTAASKQDPAREAVAFLNVYHYGHYDFGPAEPNLSPFPLS